MAESNVTDSMFSTPSNFRPLNVQYKFKIKLKNS